MNNFFTFFSALFVSVGLIPLMIRLAPHLGMIDVPDPRKVHTTPIPRVGGVGIVVGALLPISLWLKLDPMVLSFLLGSLVLLVFGVWDDSRELGHYVKFIGQFIAVLTVVYYGDVYVTRLPFFTDPISDSVGKAFSVFAMVGMINAINHSDGLDGLAGGLSVLSLCCIIYLALAAGENVASAVVTTIALATLGGILGFLRYNTHPAIVFMGDGGSQFLGFTLGFLAIALTQQVNPALSPASPVLILGLPVIDILAVFAQRVYGRMNWFRATKNHIHHRLLEIGFHHYEAVLIIYAVQTLFVVCAALLPYESDGLILALYLSVCITIFLLLALAGTRHWRIARGGPTNIPGILLSIGRSPIIQKLPVAFVSAAVPLLFVISTVGPVAIPVDMGISAALLCIVLAVVLAVGGDKSSIVFRAIAYATCAFVIYVESSIETSRWAIPPNIGSIYYLTLAIAVAIAIKVSGPERFRTNTMDYLVVVIVLSAGIFSRELSVRSDLSYLIAKLVILFYASELVISHSRSRWSPFVWSILLTLGVVGARGLAAVSIT